MTQHESPSLEIFQPINSNTFGSRLFTAEQQPLKEAIIARAHHHLAEQEATVDESPIAAAPDRDAALRQVVATLNPLHGAYAATEVSPENFVYEGVWQFSGMLNSHDNTAPVGFQTEIKLTALPDIDPGKDYDMQTAARILMHGTTTGAPLPIGAKTLFDIEGTRHGIWRPHYTYDRGEQAVKLRTAFGEELQQREDLGVYGKVAIYAYMPNVQESATVPVLDAVLERGLVRTDAVPQKRALQRAAMLVRMAKQGYPVVGP